MVRLIAEGPPKFCGMCKTIKPRDEFYAYRVKGNIYATAYCVPCSKARVVAGHRANPDRTRNTLKAMRERRKADPERMAIHRDQQRQHARRKRDIPPERWRVVDSALGGPSLDAAPFAEWFRGVMARDDASIAATAARLGLADKTAREVLKGRRDVDLATVERALIADDTVTLRELYPEFYNEAAA